ncbi:MAG: TetR/AcrR family transcriptional regulator [Bacillus sp. (in: firmicutes)]
MRSQSTEDRIINSLRQLVMQKDFEKITVQEISALAGISRKTFYQHFHDKNDVIEHIILMKITQPLQELRKLYIHHDLPSTLVLEWLYQQFYEDRIFYEHISTYTGQNSFQEFILNHTSQIISEKLADSSLSAEEKEYMIYFYASSHMMLLIKWIQDGMIVPPETMAGFYKKWTIPLWSDLNMQKGDKSGKVIPSP